MPAITRFSALALAGSALAGATLAGSMQAQAAEPFKLTSSAFSDGGALAKKNAGDSAANKNCTGQNVAPPFAWSNPPKGAKSFAFLMFDPDGANGLGVSHQVAYGIAPDKTAFKEGDLADAKAGFVGGKSSPGASVYYGPCPGPGSGQHHYVFTLVATDLAPDALEAGLTREQLVDKLKGHAKGGASVVATFGQ